MKNYIGMPRNEIRELTETILSDFYKGQDLSDVEQVDISYLAHCLNMSIAVANFAEPDMNKLGFLSDGVKYLRVLENGKVVRRRYRKNTIVLDKYLDRPENLAKERYTIGHEIGHFLLAKYGYAPAEAAFSNSFDKEREYSYDELRDILKLNELQANEVGSYLLMPAFLVDRYVKEQFGGGLIPVYGRYMMHLDTKMKIKRIAEKLGVSFGALRIQLEKLNYPEQHDASEFIEGVAN